VDGDVKTEEFDKGRILAKAKEVGQIPRVVFGCVNGGEFASAINIAIDATSYVGKFGDEVHGILENGTPIVLFGDAFLVGFSESRVVVELMESQAGVVGKGKEE
jgi:hypothetical protein